MLIAYFDIKGERLTTIVEGVHFTEDNKTEIVEQYKTELQAVYVKEVTDEEQSLLVNGTHIYKDGSIVERPAPSEEEIAEREAEATERTQDKLTTLSEEEKNELINNLMERMDDLEAKVKGE